MGGDAQKGLLSIMFDGPRIKNERSSYDPMRKQGAILWATAATTASARRVPSMKAR